jgi:hypothetical protein
LRCSAGYFIDLKVSIGSLAEGPVDDLDYDVILGHLLHEDVAEFQVSMNYAFLQVLGVFYASVVLDVIEVLGIVIEIEGEAEEIIIIGNEVIMDELQYFSQLQCDLKYVFFCKDLLSFGDLPHTVLRAILINNIFFIVQRNDFLESDNILASLVPFPFDHFVQHEKDLVLPFLADRVVVLLILFHVLLAGLYGPRLDLGLPTGATSDRFPLVDLSESPLTENLSQVEQVVSGMLPFQHAETIDRLYELLEVIIDIFALRWHFHFRRLVR